MVEFLICKFFNILNLFLLQVHKCFACMFVCVTHVSLVSGSQKASDSLPGVIDTCELTDEYWELNLAKGKACQSHVCQSHVCHACQSHGCQSHGCHACHARLARVFAVSLTSMLASNFKSLLYWSTSAHRGIKSSDHHVLSF